MTVFINVADSVLCMAERR